MKNEQSRATEQTPRPAVHSKHKQSGGKQPRASHQAQKQSELCTLKELFPAWTEDDLLGVLQESPNNDVEFAIARISEGHIKPFSQVTKNKRPSASEKGTPSFERKPFKPKPSLPLVKKQPPQDQPKKQAQAPQDGTKRVDPVVKAIPKEAVDGPVASDLPVTKQGTATAERSVPNMKPNWSKIIGRQKAVSAQFPVSLSAAPKPPAVSLQPQQSAAGLAEKDSQKNDLPDISFLSVSSDKKASHAAASDGAPKPAGFPLQFQQPPQQPIPSGIVAPPPGGFLPQSVNPSSLYAFHQSHSQAPTETSAGFSTSFPHRYATAQTSTDFYPMNPASFGYPYGPSFYNPYMYPPQHPSYGHFASPYGQPQVMNSAPSLGQNQPSKQPNLFQHSSPPIYHSMQPASQSQSVHSYPSSSKNTGSSYYHHHHHHHHQAQNIYTNPSSIAIATESSQPSVQNVHPNYYPTVPPFHNGGHYSGGGSSIGTSNQREYASSRSYWSVSQ